MIICDICGKKIEGLEYTRLKDPYRSKKIDLVCNKCHDKIEHHLWRIHEEMYPAIEKARMDWFNEFVMRGGK